MALVSIEVLKGQIKAELATAFGLCNNVKMLSRLEILMWFQLMIKETLNHQKKNAWSLVSTKLTLLYIEFHYALTCYWINQPNIFFLSTVMTFCSRTMLCLQKKKNDSVLFHHRLLIPHCLYSSGSLKQLTRAAVAVRLQYTDKHCLQSSTNTCPQR